MSVNSPFYEALECPMCDSLYVESLWSLFSHIAQTHESFPISALTFESLEKMKKVAPKSRVSIIRPAFNENGDPSLYLSALMPLHSVKPTSALSAEVAENGARTSEQQGRKPTTNGGDDERIEVKYYICIQCGEQIGDSSAIAAHKAKHHEERTSIAEENAISTLVALSNDMRGFEPSEPVTITTTPPNSLPSQSPPVKEEDLPSVDSFKIKRTRNRLNAPRPRRPALSSQAKASALTCTFCGELFQNKCKLTRHLMDHKLARNPYRCPYKDCLQSYEFKNKFKSHLLRQHQNLSAAEFTRLLDEGDKEAERLKKLEQKGVKIDQSSQAIARGLLQGAIDQVLKDNSCSDSSYGSLKEEMINVDELDLEN
ncbi:hypothetical protein QR680_018494 [Steinernema hermaphroditum]|uniref:C2H2-type domain-containing protein n=1 Tax=Steinernema hermaphroditum TaxID=289476 RepID=A0AA39LQU6_9BILA|nr:hypothetical protein QR680_018494 [Steinernema hermaphroditum]